MSVISFDTVIEFIETLSIPEQEELFELIKKRRVERRHSEIVKNAQETFEAMEQGTAKRGNLEQLRSYLLADEEE
ncbi:MAG: hypothetical protein F6K03_15640 [Kamptonema sp. SIO4C4]|nr:hypothetical protein [Kamptonema sp. SIO4C4]